ncbi:MAG: ABC transporter substrate-binding protein [Actinomycetaceae bacterium]|nr:ABC transporter substrate-binding protein [Actinomycetaceae bacterium]
MKYKKIIGLTGLISLALSASLSACTTGAKENTNKNSTVTITDQSHPERQVEITTPVNKIVTAVIPYPEVVVAVDGGSWERLVGVNETTVTLNKNNIAGELFPESKNLKVVASSNFDVDPESLTELGAQVAVQWETEDMEHLQQAGIPTLGVNYGTLDLLQGWITMTGKMIGKSERANAIINRMNETKDDIEAKVKKLNAEPVRTTTVLAVEDSAFTVFSGKRSLDSETYMRAGGSPLFTDLKESNGQVNAEEFIAVDPEVIFISGLGKAKPEDILNHPLLQNVSAVKNKRVYKTPTGIFPWQPPSAENYLMWHWSAALLHPEIYDWDERAMVKDNFKFLFNVDLTDEQLDKVLRSEMNKNSAQYTDLFGKK